MSKKAVRAYVKHVAYKRKAEILQHIGRQLDRRRALDRAVLEWEAAVIAELGGEQNLTTLQVGILRALAWDRLFLDSAAAALAGMSLVNKRDRRFYRVVLERAQLEDFLCPPGGHAWPEVLRMKRSAKRSMSIIDFCIDPQLLGLSLSPAQRTLLKSIYGLPLSKEELELFRQCTGREHYRGCPFGEATVIAGARAGKDSRIASPVVLYEAILGGHEKHLAKGERAVIPLVAQDQRATRIAFGYIREYVRNSPLLAGIVEEILSA
ncbi:MAG: hypothetical protein HY649_07300 [Acidobacteria bacterium]|nr:hypothetical protein [Acidobacteriota bacterium]